MDELGGGAAEGDPTPRVGVVRLHLGGETVRAGWRIMNIQPGPGVDYVGAVENLGQFGDGSVEEIYASHVYEHLSYQGPLQKALTEAFRVLKPGGMFRVGVPDLETLCKLYLHKELPLDARWHVQRMIFGGQTDAHDFHRVGLDFQTLGSMLQAIGFASIRRVVDFELFEDATKVKFGHVPISLNIIALKPAKT